MLAPITLCQGTQAWKISFLFLTLGKATKVHVSDTVSGDLYT